MEVGTEEGGVKGACRLSDSVAVKYSCEHS